MASLSHSSTRKLNPVGEPGITDPANLVRIRVKEPGKLQGYGAGDEFTTDSSLAAHYCDVLGIAERVMPAVEAVQAAVVENAPAPRAMAEPPARPGRKPRG